MNSIYKNVVLFLGLLAAAGCSQHKSGNTEPAAHEEEHANEVTLTGEQFRSAGIRLGSVEERNISGTIKVNGMLDVPPQNLVSISALMGGFVKETKLLQGMKVREGEVLCVMEDPSYIQLQQDYLEGSNQLELLEADYNRQQELSSENVNAQKTTQQAKAAYQNALVRVNGLKAKLRLLHIDPKQLNAGNIRQQVSIISPISGYVTQVKVNIGMYVNPADAMFRIVNTEHLHAELTVFEQDVLKLRVGQKVIFRLSGEDADRRATVHLIGREIGADRTVRVHCHLDREDAQLLPGMYLTAWIETSGQKRKVLPEKAIVTYAGRQYVYTEAEAPRSYHAVEVKTGVSENGYTEVLTDLKGTRVVTEGAYDLLSKMRNNESHDH